MGKVTYHDDVIKWKHFPRYWSVVRGIHRSPVNSPHKGQWRGAFDIFFDLRLNKRLSKQSWGWWFETLSRPLIRQCNVPKQNKVWPMCMILGILPTEVYILTGLTFKAIQRVASPVVISIRIIISQWNGGVAWHRTQTNVTGIMARVWWDPSSHGQRYGHHVTLL